MPKVKFINEKVEIEVAEGANLREEARKAGIEVYEGVTRYLNCKALGMCATCKVRVKKGGENLNKRTFQEKFTFNLHPLALLSSIGCEDEMRLSCQVKVNGDCEIETRPGMNLSGENFWQKPYPNK